jgi:hypothetical protein
VEQSDVEKLIGELELAVDRLRSLYEQYFVGIEKIEPQVPRKDVDRRIYALRKEQIRNTAMRFRFQMVLQRYNTYQTHWQRICREIENGTYKRHMIRAQRRFGSVRPLRGRSSAPPPPLAIPELPELGASLLAELDRDFAAPAAPATAVVPGGVVAAAASSPRPPLPPRPSGGSPAGVLRAGGQPAVLPASPPRPGNPPPPPAAPVWKKVAAPGVPPPLPAAPPKAVAPAASPVAPAAPPKAQPPVAPAPAAPVDLPEERLRQLYADLVETKRRQNESTAAITYQSVAKSLLESSDRLRKKHGRAVDFEVMVKDGKAVLRPVIK